MNSQHMNGPDPPAKKPDEGAPRFRGFIVATTVLLLCFSGPLYHLGWFAFHSDLYSHIILIPFISIYLVWLKRETLPHFSPPDRFWAGSFLVTGLAMLVGLWRLHSAIGQVEPEDSLALGMLSLVLLFYGICSLFLGREVCRALAFPLGLLLLIAPFPALVRGWLETNLQDGSALVADALFKIVGTPVMQVGSVLRLPGFSLEVAPQCSGIHSSLALFITSLLAGYFFLRNPWRRAILALAVIPLALLRNGFRILTIGELCVHVGPEMIDSPIHHHGGPLFFALSLVPFFLILMLLLKFDRRTQPT